MHLFVLGAGFSRSFVPTAPVLANFLKDHEGLLDKDKFVAAKRFLDKCRFDTSTANIETVMTLADQHDRDAFEQLKILIVEVLDKSFPRECCPKGTNYRFRVDHDRIGILRAFAQHLLERTRRAHVITFNYDVLLENSLELNQKRPLRFHSGRCYGFHANTWKKDGSGIRWQSEKEQKYHIFALKLHGSINWRVPNDLQNEHRVVITSSHERTLDVHFRRAAEYVTRNMKLLPLIVPPVLDKTGQAGHCALAQVWARAASLIQEARRIVFVGYSFPPTDYHAEYLFRVNYPNGCQVDVIDKGGAESDNKRLRERYGDIFGEQVTFHWGEAATELKKLMDL